MTIRQLATKVCYHKPLPGGSTIGEVIEAAGLHPQELVSEIITAIRDMPDAQLPPALVEVARQVATQDNAITADPVFVVQQKRPRVAADGYDHDRVEWCMDHDDFTSATPEEAAAFEAEFDATGELPKGWARLPMKDDWEFVTACFTRAGCEAYLKVNGHNLREPRIYVESGYRNAEWKAMRQFLLSMATPAASGQ